MNILRIAGVIVALYLVLGVFSYQNIDYVKDHAGKFYSDMGQEIICYQGYCAGQGFLFTNYGGACVYYITYDPKRDLMFESGLTRWGNELHQYGVKTFNAVESKE